MRRSAHTIAAVSDRSHGATVAILVDPLNGRSPHHITLPCSDLALPLQRERYRSQQALIAWQQRAGPAEHRQGRKPAEPVAHSASLDGAPLVRRRPPMRSWPDSDVREWFDKDHPDVRFRFEGGKLSNVTVRGCDGREFFFRAGE